MGRIRDRLRKLLRRKRRASEADVEELRRAFRHRYQEFKLLLGANSRALAVMAEIDRALAGTEPYGMTWVRAQCTRSATHVFQIAKHLNELASGRYAELDERFRDIQARIDPFLQGGASEHGGDLALRLGAVDKGQADQVGGKMANLGEIHRHLGLAVPAGFAITAAGYRLFMEHSDLASEIERRIQAADAESLDELVGLSSSIRRLILDAELPPSLKRTLADQYRLLEEQEGEGITLAVRSSALGEDMAGTSFAGQYRSELNVSGDDLSRAYREVVASKYGLPAMTYRLSRGIRDEDVAMCVGFLRMIDARAGGVLYSRNPVDIRDDSVLINSAWGLSNVVVDGRTPVDHFVVSRAERLRIASREIAEQERKSVCAPGEGLEYVELDGEDRSRSSLDDETILELARVAIRLEEHYGAPQDVEWALGAEGSITILQCRPLQQEEVAERGAGGAAFGPTLLEGGVTAARGVAAGPVCPVAREVDVLRFPEGGVLVALQALPRWAPALCRAAAVVCEQGTVTCHLANVARELGVPALFGVEGAARELAAEQVITVDADGRSLYEGRVEALLELVHPARNLMEGSPVHAALEGAARLIVPLTLIDPDAAEFRPESCQTLHDITRFCHEKAVQEMFRFGRDHHFPERSSKQLFCDVPMQWWVLNLDDGFQEEVEGKYVRIENIASIPMLALWEGITAVPWEGPPPIDGKGFMSVMFGATANTALSTGVRSRYSDRNYFMISRNFLSLSSRLGAHFSIVETIVSERLAENYISFQFKGGAADLSRRLLRVEFVREILEEYGFLVKVNRDNLIARMEGFDEEHMKGRLRILGYLAIHTRQIDMIMANEALVDRYRTKFHGDIGALLAGGGPQDAAAGLTPR